VLAGGSVIGLGQAAAQGLEQVMKMIHQGLMVKTLRVGLLLDDAPGPTFDQNAGVALNERTNLGMRLSADQLWIDGHP
jgi:hypothetical protein